MLVRAARVAAASTRYWSTGVAALMARAGVPVVDRCFDDLIHGFYNIGITRPTLLAAHEINRTIAAALEGNSAPD